MFSIVYYTTLFRAHPTLLSVARLSTLRSIFAKSHLVHILSATMLTVSFLFASSFSVASAENPHPWGLPFAEHEIQSTIVKRNFKPAEVASLQSAGVVTSNVSIGEGFDLIKQCESGGNYAAINPAGYYGAYQFSQGTWDSAAAAAGRGDLVGTRPDQAAPADQDALAKQLHSTSGWYPWGCAYIVGLL